MYLELANSEDVFIEYNKNSTKVIVCFGGVNQGMGIPTFEFKNLLKKYNTNQIFIRDSYQAWYQKGIRGIDNFLVLKELLERELKKFDEIFFIGNSMGGFAALLLGSLLHVNRILVFSPQTFIDRLRRLYYRDKRWHLLIKEIYLSKNQKILDVKNIIKNKEPFSDIEVHYSSLDRLDKIHAARLKKQPNCKLFNYEEGGHSLVKVLKEKGQLDVIIKDFIYHVH